MVRINLLPPYIYEGSKRTKVTVLWVVILLAVIGGFIYAQTTINGQTAEIAADTERQRPDADLADRLFSETQQIQASSAVVRGKADFVRQAQSNVAEWYPKVYENVRNYTYYRVKYDQVLPSGPTVQINAWSLTLADVGQYMLAMRRNPEINRLEVAMNSIPSFPVGATQNQQGGFGGQNQQADPQRPPGHTFVVTLMLKNPIGTPPAYPAAGGGQGGGQGPGGPGGMGPMGPGGGGMSSGGMMGGMNSGGMMGGGAAPGAAPMSIGGETRGASGAGGGAKD